MPSKHRVRNFQENGFYHVFNRGVEKRKIFLNDNDYKIFQYYLYIYLKPLDQILATHPSLPIRLQARNMSDEIELIAYCLMPNHFHFLIKQRAKNGIPLFMKQISNAYTEYFNKKYGRTGGLMQGRYKAVEVNSDELLLHISRYIHLNPFVSGLTKATIDYPWSSYAELINQSSSFTTDFAPKLVGGVDKYHKFVEDHAAYARELHILSEITLDSDQ